MAVLIGAVADEGVNKNYIKPNAVSDLCKKR